MARISQSIAGGANVLAFLDMLAWSELKPKLIALSDDGYNVIVGSTPNKPHLFQSYADHPKVYVSINAKLRSSAAGRYQFLERTWKGLVKKLELADFSPENQDRAAIELLRECGAYPQVVGGSIEGAIRLAAPIWASLPGAGYGQHENRLSELLSVFNDALGKVRADFTNVEADVDSTAPKVAP